MAVTQYSIDNSEWTFLYEVSSVRSDMGVFVEQMIELPFAFVRFADVGEERKYVVPTNSGAWVSANGIPAGRIMGKEFMPGLPFPLDSSRPPGSGSGAWAVHQFGWV